MFYYYLRLAVNLWIINVKIKTELLTRLLSHSFVINKINIFMQDKCNNNHTAIASSVFLSVQVSGGQQTSTNLPRFPYKPSPEFLVIQANLSAGLPRVSYLAPGPFWYELQQWGSCTSSRPWGFLCCSASSETDTLRRFFSELPGEPNVERVCTR